MVTPPRPNANCWGGGSGPPTTCRQLLGGGGAGGFRCAPPPPSDLRQLRSHSQKNSKTRISHSYCIPVKMSNTGDDFSYHSSIHPENKVHLESDWFRIPLRAFGLRRAGTGAGPLPVTDFTGEVCSRVCGAPPHASASTRTRPVVNASTPFLGTVHKPARSAMWMILLKASTAY